MTHQEPTMTTAPPASHPAQAKRTLGRRGLLALITATTLVLAAAVTAGVWMLRSPDGSTTPAAGKQAADAKGTWSLPDSSYGLARNHGVRGLWFQGQTVIKPLPEGLVALDRSTGRRQWSIPTPDNGTLCQTSSDTTDNRLVLAYGSGTSCDHFFAVDLARHTVLWKQTLQISDWAPEEGPRIARSGDTVVLESDKAIPAAYRVSDGRRLWQDNDGKYQTGGDEPECRGTQYTGGRQLLRMYHCLESDVTEIAAVDPATGHNRWTHKTADSTGIKILSSSPVIYTEPDPDRPYDGYLRMSVLDDGGRPRARLAPGDERRFPDIADNGSALAADVQVRGDVLVATTKTGIDSKGDSATKLVAWSLTSGKRLWEHTASKGTDYVPTLSDQPQILTYLDGHGATDTLLRIDPATGRQQTVRQYPRDDQQRLSTRYFPVIDRQTVFLLSDFEEKLPNIEKSPKAKALMVRPA
ncbi:PQQ-binding-like beta-propeller repeat protein [Streptomyces mobaraensis]|uniref:PQQ-binding-like beta-propeller repeat protein n=1 Tax=Streptomyces mobaraensis TaxID=35621 RepID=A0A5N5W345_STRMB|nr:PQQ-binding-like beta-propeller repeat protein [Streptomyces mobaraensis]KAB7835783.1 PQQ-binding-like beta-propeller repeat protein [Streptomyces mobaraensis]